MYSLKSAMCTYMYICFAACAHAPLALEISFDYHRLKTAGRDLVCYISCTNLYIIYTYIFEYTLVRVYTLVRNVCIHVHTICCMCANNICRMTSFDRPAHRPAWYGGEWFDVQCVCVCVCACVCVCVELYLLKI